MKKQLRFVLFAVLVLLMITVTAVAASAATPFETGGKSYATFEGAVAAVSDGGTVTVTENVTLSADVTLSSAVAYTIKGSTGSETVTFTAGGLVINAGTVTIENLSIVANAANTITVNNSTTTLKVMAGTVVKSEGTTDTTGLAITCAGYSTLLIEGGTFYGAIGASTTTAAAGATITINNGTFYGNSKTSLGNLLRTNRAGFRLTVNGGTFNFTSTSVESSSLLYSNSASATVTITGGTFTGTGTNPAPVLYCRQGTYSISGGEFYSYMAGKSSDIAPVLLVNGSETDKSDCTISGGKFYACGGDYSYPVYVRACTSMKITGGFFTFADTLASADSIDISMGEPSTNSIGKNFCYGVSVTTAAPVRISGGTFMGGSSYRAFTVGACVADVVISGGTFYGHRAVDTYASGGTLTIVDGNFYPNPGQPNCKLLDVRSANAVVNVYGGTFDANYTAVGNPSTGGVVYFEKAGQLNIYGGTFSCQTTSTDGTLIHMATAGTVQIGTGAFTLDTTTYTGNGPIMNKTGAGALIRVNAEGAIAQIKAGSFVASDDASVICMQANGTVTVSAGTFTAEDTATAVYTKSGGSVIVNGGTFTAGDTATLMYLVAGNTTVNGGTFKGTGVCLIELALSKDTDSFKVTGGIFTLEDPISTASNGGAVIRTGMGVIPQDVGQYYDPTDMYCYSSADIQLLGGVFVDNRTANNQIVDATLGTSRVVIDGAILLSRHLQMYFVDANGAVSVDIPMMTSSPVCTYNGATYYCYIATETTDSTMAPVMEEGAGVTITASYEGIRFTSYIPADVIANLPEGYTFGTLIAPADYVVAAGGFTHQKLDALKESTPSLGTVYVDIVAKNSIKQNADGSVSFSGALVSLKQQNYTRALAAVSYVEINGTYYYSTYDPADNARTMAYIAKEAYTAVADIPDEDHVNPSVYKLGAYSAFTKTEQGILKTYSSYTHTWDSATVTLSANITVGSDASANLQAAANTLRTTLSGFGTSGAPILVGNTGDAEVATALSEIEGYGYYVGVINGKIVIVGSTNALTMQALAYFNDVFLANAKQGAAIVLWEKVSSNVKMIPLTSETAFVYQHTRDGNTIAPYTTSSRLNADIAFNSDTNHLYNYEDNPEFVDYPVVAAMEIAAKLNGSASNYCYVPDNLSFGDQNIHVGITELALQTVLKGKDVGYYGYAIQDGNVIISSFDDATLRLAKELFIKDLPDFAVNGTYMIPADYEFEKGYSDGFTGAFSNYSDDTKIQAGANYVAAELALLPTDFPRPTGLQLSGAVNVDSNSLELYYQNSTVADYKAYCQLLEENGYTEYMAERCVEGSYFVTYYNATTNLTLHVIYNKYLYSERETTYTGTQLSEMFTPTLRVIAAKVDNSNINLLPKEYFSGVQSTGNLTTSKLTVVQIHYGNFGFCYVYTLEDGRFVVLDGGGGETNAADAENLYNVLTELYKESHNGNAPSTSNKIEIAAWYLSHGHGDHYPMMANFINTYCNHGTAGGLGALWGSYDSTVHLNAIIGNFASNDEIYNSMDPTQNFPNLIGTDSWYKNNGVAIPYYKVHTGQQFFIGNLEFEVMYTHEDIHPWSMLYFNNTSTVIRLTVHNTDGKGNILAGSTSISNMALGDLQARGSMVLRATWGDYLKSDIVLTAHHGGNGIEGESYKLIDAQIVLWSHAAENVDGLWNATSTSAYIKENREWLASTHWYYIFTGRAYENTLASDEFYNLTMTITEDGIAGLYEGGDDVFIQGLRNIAGGSANTSLSYGTGLFNGTDYVGDGYLVHRDNFDYEMPVMQLPDDMDCDWDVFGDVVHIFG